MGRRAARAVAHRRAARGPPQRARHRLCGFREIRGDQHLGAVSSTRHGVLPDVSERPCHGYDTTMHSNDMTSRTDTASRRCSTGMVPTWQKTRGVKFPFAHHPDRPVHDAVSGMVTTFRVMRSLTRMFDPSSGEASVTPHREELPPGHRLAHRDGASGRHTRSAEFCKVRDPSIKSFEAPAPSVSRIPQILSTTCVSLASPRHVRSRIRCWEGASRGA
jgi:hypothetical protein